MFSRPLCCLIGLTFAACVTTGTYDQKVAELTEANARAEAAAKKDAEAKRAAFEAELAAVKKELAEANARLAEGTRSLDDTHARLNEQVVLVGELKKRLEKLGQNVDRLMSEKGQLNQVLEDSKARLEELRKQREAAEARLATFRKLVERFQSMIDANQLKVVVRNGRMLISMPDNVLFDSGKTELKAGGATALTKVAEVLATIPDRHFVVAGHTDDIPIKTARFPSNWELSTARAVDVVNFLIAHGLKPGTLSAAGYGEFDPVAANDSPEHRALNRRIEIVLQPNLAELPSLESLTAG